MVSTGLGNVVVGVGDDSDSAPLHDHFLFQAGSAGTVGVDDPATAGADLSVALHPCEVAGGCYVWDLAKESPAVAVDRSEGTFALGVWLGCEVKTEVLTPYRRLADVRNTAGSGAAGQAQVMPLHAPRMAAMGLDFEQEYHRVLYGFWMFGISGAGPWSCRHTPVPVVGSDHP